MCACAWGQNHSRENPVHPVLYRRNSWCSGTCTRPVASCQISHSADVLEIFRTPFPYKETGSFSLRSQPWNLFKNLCPRFFFFLFHSVEQRHQRIKFSLQTVPVLVTERPMLFCYLFFFPAWNIHQPVSGLIYDVIPSVLGHKAELLAPSKTVGKKIIV